MIRSERADGANLFLKWITALAGTAAAGGIFGLVEGGILGLVVGTVLAGVYGAPILLTVAVLTWALWLDRFSRMMAAAGGALTGLVSTSVIWGPIFATDFPTALVLAASIGGIVPGLAIAYFYHCRSRKERTRQEVAWQFSLRTLFFRFAIVTILIAIWTAVVTGYLGAERHLADMQAIGSD